MVKLDMQRLEVDPISKNKNLNTDGHNKDLQMMHTKII